MRSFVIVLTGVIAFSTLVQGFYDLPGYQFTFASTALTKWVQALIPEVEQFSSKIVLPDISGSFDLKVANITYKLSSISISDVKLPYVYAEIVEGIGLDAISRNCSAKCKLTWEYKDVSWPYTEDSGTADISITLSMSERISSKRDPKTLLVKISSLSNVVNIEKLDIKLHGGGSFFYNALISIFKDQVQSMFEVALEEALSTTLVEVANKRLTEIPYREIDHLCVMDMRLTADPIITKNAYEVPMSGQISIWPNEWYPQQPKKMPGLMGNFDIQILWADAVFNSDWVAHVDAGYSNSSIGRSEVPDQFKKRFETDTYADVISGLPGGHEMRLDIKTNGYPFSEISFGAMLTNISTKVSVSTRKVGSQHPFAYAFAFAASTVAINEQYAHFHFDNGTDPTMSLSSMRYNSSLWILDLPDPIQVHTADFSDLVLNPLCDGVILPFFDASSAYGGYHLAELIVAEYKINDWTKLKGDGFMGMGGVFQKQPESADPAHTG